MRAVADPQRIYAEFWKDLVEHPDGTLNRDVVMRELSDFHEVMEQVSIAYCAVTGGRISKPNTAAHHVIGEVNERIEEAVRDAENALREEIAEHPDNPLAALLREALELRAYAGAPGQPAGWGDWDQRAEAAIRELDGERRDPH